MPVYDFRCPKCGLTQEQFSHTNSHPKAISCPCGSKAKYVISGTHPFIIPSDFGIKAGQTLTTQVQKHLDKQRREYHMSDKDKLEAYREKHRFEAEKREGRQRIIVGA